MNNIIYIKVFKDLPGIIYKKSTFRISRGHTLLGLGTLLFAGLFFIESNNHFLAGSLLFIVFVSGFFISLARVRSVQSDIVVAVSKDQMMVETKYAYDGGNSWFPISPFVAILMGLAINKFTDDLYWQNILYIIIMGFVSGFVLAVGLTYMYLEYKYNTKIKVYGYTRNKK